MENIRFKMTFLDSIVLSKTSNTEGNIEPLDFVSGSCFLGIGIAYKILIKCLIKGILNFVARVGK